MRYTILFIAILVVVSGFIAYFGDFIGRKMGKKRLTLFGMRPRHTAIVVTTITGMVIAVLTLVTVAGISTSIREVLVAGEQKIAENKELQGKNSRLLGTNRQLQEQEQTARRSFDKARQELTTAQSARDDAVAKIDDLTKEITANLKQLDDLKGKKMLTQKQLEEKARKLDELAGNLRTMQEMLAKKKQELTLVQEQRDNLQEYNKKQLTTIESQKEAIAMQQDQLRDQYAKLVEMGKANLDLQDDVKNLQYRFMGGDIVMKQGQELTRRVISQNQSVLGIKNEILAVLSDASDKARKMGAASGKNDRAVVVIAPSAEDKCITAAADAISGSAAPVLVQVLCITNTFKDEQAHVQFKLFPNALAFSRGKTLASATIDGRQPEGKILLSVIGFLRANVRKAADAAGVVPVASSDPEITGDQLDELMDLVTKIKEMNARIRLRASAEKDIYAAGPLDLRTIEFSISTVTAKASEGR